VTDSRFQVLNPPQQHVSAPPPQRQSDPQPSFSSRQGPPQAYGVPQSPHQMQGNTFNNQGQLANLQQHERSFSQGQPFQQYNNGPPGSAGGSPRGPPPGHGAYNTGSISSSGPPQLSSLPFQPSQSHPPPISQQHIPPGYPQSPGPNSGHLPPVKPVFGLSLDELFDRDNSAVPMVVYQCIQAVDLFGLEVEGIYRLSGTASHITKLKAMFDNGKPLCCTLKYSANCLRCNENRLPQSGKFLSRRE
jgi:hypothetical protein